MSFLKIDFSYCPILGLKNFNIEEVHPNHGKVFLVGTPGQITSGEDYFRRAWNNNLKDK
jgi:hypothetical protein